MKILVIDDDDSIRQFVTLVLENIIPDPNITECYSGDKAIEVLEKDRDFACIICDYEMPDGNGGKVYNYIRNQNIEVPFALFTSHHIDKLEEFKNLPFREGIDTFIQKGEGGPAALKMGLCQVLSNLDELIDEYAGGTKDEYKRVRIYYFWRFNKCLCDIYLRLSDEKYVKIIHKNDFYDRQTISKYADKNQKYLYVKGEDFDSFSGTIRSQPFLVLEGENMTPAQKIDTTNAIIQSLVKTTGVSPAVVKMAEKNIKETIEQVKDVSVVSDLLSKLRKRDDYIHDHSSMMSYICCILCDHMGWSTRSSREKLCFASLFHDITLDDPDLAMCVTLDEVVNNCSPAERTVFEKHPEEAAALVEDLNNRFPGLDRIILEHHENPEGSGFPRQLNHRVISPLAALFIIAHDFVRNLYLVDFDESHHDEILAEMKKRYTEGHYLKVMEQLPKILSK